MSENSDGAIDEGLCPRRLAVTFRPPPGRWESFDREKIDGLPEVEKARLYRGELLGVQPDLLVDIANQTAVGLVFEITDPINEVPRLKRMLADLDSRAIRMSEHGVAVDGRPPRRNVYYDNPSLEVLWADSEDYEVVLGQLDYGMWSFLYDTSTPTLLDDGDDWSVPVGLITSLDDIHYPIELSRKGFRDLDVRFV